MHREVYADPRHFGCNPARGLLDHRVATRYEVRKRKRILPGRCPAGLQERRSDAFRPIAPMTCRSSMTGPSCSRTAAPSTCRIRAVDARVSAATATYWFPGRCLRTSYAAATSSICSIRSAGLAAGPACSAISFPTPRPVDRRSDGRIGEITLHLQPLPPYWLPARRRRPSKSRSPRGGAGTGRGAHWPRRRAAAALHQQLLAQPKVHPIDDWTIVYDQGSTIYVQNPKGGCPGIGSGQRHFGDAAIRHEPALRE